MVRGMPDTVGMRDVMTGVVDRLDFFSVAFAPAKCVEKPDSIIS